MRHRADGPVYEWEFEIDGVEVVRRLTGPFILNDPGLVLQAVRKGSGIGYVTLPETRADLDSGRLRRALTDFCPPFDGYHLYYLGKRNLSSALRLLIDRLRARRMISFHEANAISPSAGVI